MGQEEADGPGTAVEVEDAHRVRCLIGYAVIFQTSHARDLLVHERGLGAVDLEERADIQLKFQPRCQTLAAVVHAHEQAFRSGEYGAARLLVGHPEKPGDVRVASDIRSLDQAL